MDSLVLLGGFSLAVAGVSSMIKAFNCNNQWKSRLMWFRVCISIGVLSCIGAGILMSSAFASRIQSGEGPPGTNAIGVGYIVVTWLIAIAGSIMFIKDRNLLKKQMLGKNQSPDSVEAVEDAKWAESLQSEKG